MNGWKPIATAPMDEAVLVFLTGAAMGLEIEIAYCSSDDSEGDWYPATTDGPPLDVLPSHWMPLPDPPRQEPEHG